MLMLPVTNYTVIWKGVNAKEKQEVRFNGNNKNKYSFGANACCQEETVILR